MVLGKVGIGSLPPFIFPFYFFWSLLLLLLFEKVDDNAHNSGTSQIQGG